jgi:hypothetical protein
VRKTSGRLRLIWLAGRFNIHCERLPLPEKDDPHGQMSLTPLSSSSNPSEKPVAAKGKPKRPEGKDLDLSLKLQVAAALAASGYYTRINVLLSATSSRGIASATRDWRGIWKLTSGFTLTFGTFKISSSI